jgi:hypothetical protein
MRFKKGWKQSLNPELTDSEKLKILHNLGINEVTVKFIYDLETGTVDSDVVDENGVDIWERVAIQSRPGSPD